MYCEVHRNEMPSEQFLDVSVMATELKRTLAFVLAGRVRERSWFHSCRMNCCNLRHVTLSGDGEPTLAANFVEAVQEVVHLRAMGGFPFFKIVLITNATALDQPQVQQGLKLFTRSDEVWIKLDGGTQAYLNKVDKIKCSTRKNSREYFVFGRQRPVVIQSLFPLINGEEPPLEEIEQYALALERIERSRRSNSVGANLFRHTSDAEFDLRASAVKDVVPYCANGPACCWLQAEVF